jgi:polar amino acid transport system permease protein
MTLYILKGSGVTLGLYAVTAIFSMPLGFMFALGKISKNKILNSAVGIYTWIFRGTPLLLQLFFTYYGLPVFGVRWSGPFVPAALTFIVNYAAYLTEIFRAGIQSIDKGQYEAAKVLGMSYSQTMRKIIIPQTIKRILPPLGNEAINLVKDTALVSVIALAEILRNAKEIVTREFIITPFFIAAAVYLIFTSVIVLTFNHMEEKYSYYE